MNHIKLAVPWLLCLAGLLFPFSVAATNVVVAVALAAGIVSGLFWHGLLRIRDEFRPLALTLAAYFLLLFLGLLWSVNRGYGLEVVAHQWFWLVLPVVVMALAEPRWRERFLFFLSVGLTIHLGFCVLQKLGLVQLDFGGSHQSDPTGYIGHISFGIVYGIWSGWLLHWGWKQKQWRRWGGWLLSLWALGMIFSAQGRGGYLVALLVLLSIFVKQYKNLNIWVRLVPVVLVGVMAMMLVAGPGKARLVEAWGGLDAIWHGDIEHADARWPMWIGAFEVWKESPVLGAGTGGFQSRMAEVWKQRPELVYIGSNGMAPSHPHNMYMFALARLGLVGFCVFVLLLVCWCRTGWRVEWSASAQPLIWLSGIALSVDALLAPTPEQHFSGIMLVFTLGAGLAEGIWHQQRGYANMG